MTIEHKVQIHQRLRTANVESLKALSLALEKVKGRASALPEHEAMAQLVLDTEKAVAALRLTTEAFAQLGKHLCHAIEKARASDGQTPCEVCGLAATTEGLLEGGDRYIAVCNDCQGHYSFLADGPLGSLSKVEQ